jgi:hypothetical protein
MSIDHLAVVSNRMIFEKGTKQGACDSVKNQNLGSFTDYPILDCPLKDRHRALSIFQSGVLTCRDND